MLYTISQDSVTDQLRGAAFLIQQQSPQRFENDSELRLPPGGMPQSCTGFPIGSSVFKML